MKSYNLSLSLAQRPNNTSTVDFLRVTLVPAMAEPHVGRGSRCSAEGQRVAAVFMAGHQFLPFNMSPEKETGLSVRDDGAFFTALSPLLLCPSVQGPDTAFWSWLEELIKDTHTHAHAHEHAHAHAHTHTHTHRHECVVGMGKVFEVGSCTDTRGQPCCYDLARAV